MREQPVKEVSILLVEDDDIDAMGVQRTLTAMRLVNPLLRARNGIEALEILRNNTIQRPYLILLDLNMPKMNGLQMLEELRRDPELSSSVVFVFTTSKDEQDIFAAYQGHIAGYIIKSELTAGFKELFEMLDCYWRLVELPVDSEN